MKDRIILLIKAMNLTAAQFADEIGVQKSSISHILSGRNNASLDFIQKVLLNYPEVNTEWLMFGKGPIFKSNDTATNRNADAMLSAVSPQSIPPVDLFSTIPTEKGKEFRKENDFTLEVKKQVDSTEELREIDSLPKEETKKQMIDETASKTEAAIGIFGHKNSNTKTILKFVEFYSDNTFKEYFPE